jgi:D-amino peptidase
MPARQTHAGSATPDVPIFVRPDYPPRMRVLIMADMEGVSGIVVWDQVNGGAPMYEECRRLYTEEINAAVRGAKVAGATEIDPDCTWVNHHPWSRYTELLENGCDVALMVAMHARAGTPDGVLCHTISTTTWRNLYFNNDLVGEFGINCALCGHFGVPVALITGDEATCREGKELLGEQLKSVAVKKGLSRYSARNIPPVRARQLIQAGVTDALQSRNWPKPYVPAKPTTITIELSTVDSASQFKGKPGIELVDPLKVVSRGKDWMEAWNNFWGW